MPAVDPPRPSWSPPPPSSPPPSSGNGHARKPLAEAFGRALVPSTPAPAPAAPPAAAETDDLEEKKAKTRKLYEVAGKALTYLAEGGLKRAVRFAGREAADMDEDEEELIREGFEELCAVWFGRVELGPTGKVAVGCVVAGVGMYMGGTKIEKPKELPPAAQPAPPREAPREEERSA